MESSTVFANTLYYFFLVVVCLTGISYAFLGVHTVKQKVKLLIVGIGTLYLFMIFWKGIDTLYKAEVLQQLAGVTSLMTTSSLFYVGILAFFLCKSLVQDGRMKIGERFGQHLLISFAVFGLMYYFLLSTGTVTLPFFFLWQVEIDLSAAAYWIACVWSVGNYIGFLEYIKPKHFGLLAFFGPRTRDVVTEGIEPVPGISLWVSLVSYEAHLPFGWSVSKVIYFEPINLSLQVQHLSQDGHRIALFVDVVYDLVDPYVYDQQGEATVKAQVGAWYQYAVAKYMQGRTYAELVDFFQNHSMVLIEDDSCNPIAHLGVRIAYFTSWRTVVLSPEVLRMLDLVAVPELQQRLLRQNVNTVTEVYARLPVEVRDVMTSQDVLALMHMATGHNQYSTGTFNVIQKQ